jgi:hypothetical protein
MYFVKHSTVFSTEWSYFGINGFNKNPVAVNYGMVKYGVTEARLNLQLIFYINFWKQKSISGQG